MLYRFSKCFQNLARLTPRRLAYLSFISLDYLIRNYLRINTKNFLGQPERPEFTLQSARVDRENIVLFNQLLLASKLQLFFCKKKTTTIGFQSSHFANKINKTCRGKITQEIVNIKQNKNYFSISFSINGDFLLTPLLVLILLFTKTY